MAVKILIVAFLLIIIVNLGMAAYYMLKDGGQSDRTLKALTRRVTLSVILFGLLLLGMALGIIEPHGLVRQP